MEKEREKAIKILSEIENYLESKNVEISNKERDEYIVEEGETPAILFGSEYYQLEDKITEILKE
jgi:hypothetical protein